MSIILDQKYLFEISSRLLQFKRVGDHLWNFRCPICGDSQVSSTKARGYVFVAPDRQGLLFKCHNCGVSTTFGHFLESTFPDAYSRYKFERILELKEAGLLEDRPREKAPTTDYSFFKAKSDFVLEDEILAPLTRIDKLPDGHPAKEYVRGRLIPRDKWRLLYYSDDFMGYVNSFKAGKFSNPFKEERLIIPYFDEHGRVFAMQGRALDPEASVRYFTVKVDDNAERVFGIERLNYSKPIYITEGPIDSLFLPNALAVSGSSFESPFVEGLKTNATLVFDNEPRSPQICKLIHRMLVKGFRVCLWNANITFKDINEGILAGFTADEIVDIIERSSVKGVAGLARFSLWKKC